MALNTLIVISLTVATTWLPSAPRTPQLPGPSAASSADASGTNTGMIPFASNGCSGFREARFFTCCFVHDLDFWAGGTWADRSRADRTLRSCLLEVSHDWIVTGIGYMLIRLETIPGAFVKDGWGRAWWNTPRSRFAPLTPEQQRQVADERQRVCRSLTLDPTTGHYRVDARRTIRPAQAREVCGGDPPATAGSGPPPTSP